MPGASEQDIYPHGSLPITGNNFLNRRLSFNQILFLVLSATILWALVWIPSLFSFDLWIFKDRGGFMHLDEFVDRGERLGIDVPYTYGLAAVLVQRILFDLFGKSYVPMIGFAIVYVVAVGILWAAMVAKISRTAEAVLSALILIPVVLFVNPNPPYAIVILSMLSTLLLILHRRYDWALAAAAVGALSVPSLPLAIFIGLVVTIVVDWALHSDRKIGNLVRRLLPGFAVYGALAIILAMVFSLQSLAATILPFQGTQFYYQDMTGIFGWPAIVEFLTPRGYDPMSIVKYIGGRAHWWVISTLLIVIFAARAAWCMLRDRKIDPFLIFIVTCAAVHLVFIFFAYGATAQHLIFDPVLAAGVFCGIMIWSWGGWRTPLLIIFLLPAAVHGALQVGNAALDWRGATRSPATAGLIGQAHVVSQWEAILERAKRERLFFLAYSPAHRYYFPNVGSPDVWMLQPGLFSERQRDKVLEEIDAAEIVVLDRTSSLDYYRSDPEFQNRLSEFCMESLTPEFVILSRAPRDGVECLPQRPL